MALPAGVTLNWIWPYMPLTNANEYNAEGFEMLMYRPLYMFGNNGPSVAVNYPLSLADAPVYSADGKTVTITMKGWKWSNGETVDASDVIFWLNMMKAEPANYYGYVPGLLPDNLASYSATDANTVVLHLKSAVSSIWFTYNQLAEITPMPTAWDVTSAGATAGSGGCATDTAADKWAKCTAVFNFLTAQAKNAKTYATNPIWGVVDGPWKLSSFSTAASGPVTSFVPNAAYSGSPKPQLAGITYYAYTDDTTEYTALKTGQLDVGVHPAGGPAAGLRQPDPAVDQPARQRLQPVRRRTPSASSTSYINFNNPTIGPAFKQLYVRQAIQELIDQEGMIKTRQPRLRLPDLGRRADPADEPVGPGGAERRTAARARTPFSVANATALLTSHGWKNVGGVMTCQTTASPSAAPGVTAGTKLSMTMDYATGITAFQQEVAIIKSDMAQAGIAMNLVPQSFNTIIGETAPCKPTQAELQVGHPQLRRLELQRPRLRADRRAAVRRPARRRTRAATPTRRWTS